MPTISESKKGKIKIAVNYSDHKLSALTKELLVDWNLARQGKEPKWIDWTID